MSFDFGMAQEVCMVVKNEQPPIDDLLEIERRNGEILISRLRLVILIGFVPVLYLLRFFTGYISLVFIPLVVGKWALMCAAAYLVYYFLQRGYYRPFIGYFTMMLDFAFITISVIMLSFYKSMPTGAMNDPVFILYYLVGISSVLRYHYEYVIFSIATGIAIIASLAAFDMHYFHIPLDSAVLIDRIAAFVFFTLMSISFSKLIKESVARGYSIMERHLRVIDAILDIGRKIASHGELKRSLTNITIKAKDLMQFDVSWILLFDESSQKVTCISDVDLPQPFENHELINAAISKTLPALAEKSGLTFQGKPLIDLAGTPIKTDEGIAGALLMARITERPGFVHDHALLEIFAEQTAICIGNSRLLQQLKKETVYLYQQLDDLSCFEDIIGSSPRMQEIFAVINKVAATDMPVYISGESGTGKELVAQALHNLSRRKNGPFIKINCAAIPSELLESELFGYEKGAFTGAAQQKQGKFELADGGTIVLDEIGEMSPYLQAKLLRVIETKEIERLGDVKKRKIDARIIATTNKDITKEIKEGRFREDLYFRLAQIHITVPPLRERKEDIPILIETYLLAFSKDSGEFKHIAKDVFDLLAEYDWPGNVRELVNSIKRAVIMCDGNHITLDDLPLHLKNKRRLDANTYSDTLLDDAISATEKQMIIDALKKTKGSQVKAAKLLGISERSMWYRVKKYGIVDN